MSVRPSPNNNAVLAFNVRTVDAVAIDVIIASVPTNGDMVQLASIAATGRRVGGLDGITRHFTGALVRTSGGATTLLTASNDTAVFGGFGGPAVVTAVGTDVVMRLTGVAADVDWVVTAIALPVANADVLG